MTCSWQSTPEDPPCGEPADGFRVRFIPVLARWHYCRRHLAILRRLKSDEEARTWGVETYPGPYVIEDQEGTPLISVG